MFACDEGIWRQDDFTECFRQQSVQPLLQFLENLLNSGQQLLEIHVTTDGLRNFLHCSSNPIHLPFHPNETSSDRSLGRFGEEQTSFAESS